MKTTRVYQMKARADAAAQTRLRILRAAFDLTLEKMSLEIVLSDIAERAGVSVQTVLRHFGSREGLFDAVSEFAQEQITEERRAPVGDVKAAVAILFEHYELRGDAVLRFLGQEAWDPMVRQVTAGGRQTHRVWVEEVFAPQLATRSKADREAVTDLLVIATDIYTWKILRRDRGLGRRAAQQRVLRLIDAILR